MINQDAIDYGLIKHKDPNMIKTIEKTLSMGYSPEEIGAKLHGAEFSLSPSEINEIVGAAKFIVKQLAEEEE